MSEELSQKEKDEIVKDVRDLFDTFQQNKVEGVPYESVVLFPPAMELHPPKLGYSGFTYPRILQNKLAHWFWRKFFCPKGIHLWDEVYSPSMTPDIGTPNYLYCDACGSTIDFVKVSIRSRTKELRK